MIPPLREHSVADAHFLAFRDANLFYPQNKGPIALLLAHSLINDPQFEPITFARSNLNPQQLESLKRDVNRAHSAREIPRATLEGKGEAQSALHKKYGSNAPEVRTITDRSIESVWRGVRDRSVIFLNEIAATVGMSQRDRIANDPFGFSAAFQGRRLASHLTDINVRWRVKQALDVISEAMHSPEGEDIARRVRALFDRRPEVHDFEAMTAGERAAKQREYAGQLYELIIRSFDEAGRPMPNALSKFFKSQRGKV